MASTKVLINKLGIFELSWSRLVSCDVMLVDNRTRCVGHLSLSFAKFECMESKQVGRPTNQIRPLLLITNAVLKASPCYLKFVGNS